MRPMTVVVCSLIPMTLALTGDLLAKDAPPPPELPITKSSEKSDKQAENKAPKIVEWKNPIKWAEPRKVTPGADGSPPSDAIVLFDGKDLSAWKNPDGWKLEDGYGLVTAGVSTKQGFGDCQLHLEFAAPAEVEGTGQQRGNSGIYFMGYYETQILDSWENPTYFDGQLGSVYKQQPPLVNPARKPGEWQTYDVIFTAPSFHEDGSVKTPAAITALINGVLVQNHFVLQGSTDYHRPPFYYESHGPRKPLNLQFHGDKVRFRNIWIRDLQPEDQHLKPVK